MRRTAAITMILLATGTCLAEEQSLLGQAADAFIREAFKESKSPIGEAFQEEWREKENAKTRALPQKKSVKECMRPDRVIDERVRRCTKGL